MKTASLYKEMNKKNRQAYKQNLLIEVEKKYSDELKKAKEEDNQDKMINLYFELNVLRKFYK